MGMSMVKQKHIIKQGLAQNMQQLGLSMRRVFDSLGGESGSIDRNSFKLALRMKYAVGLGMDAAVDALFDGIDTNSDGQVSFEEFERAFSVPSSKVRPASVDPQIPKIGIATKPEEIVSYAPVVPKQSKSLPPMYTPNKKLLAPLQSNAVIAQSSLPSLTITQQASSPISVGLVQKTLKHVDGENHQLISTVTPSSIQQLPTATIKQHPFTPVAPKSTKPSYVRRSCKPKKPKKESWDHETLLRKVRRAKRIKGSRTARLCTRNGPAFSRAIKLRPATCRPVSERNIYTTGMIKWKDEQIDNYNVWFLNFFH